VPDELALGVADDVLASHVAWDPGAASAACALAAALDVSPILGEWTRLVADLNRPETSTAVVPAVAFGVDVPGNRNADRAARLARYHRPYWQRVRAAVEAALERGTCVHLSVHSFDATFGDDPAGRDFDLGLLYDPAFPAEAALAGTIEHALVSRGLRVRHNQPYAGVDEGLVQTLRHHYAARPYVGLELELSQQRLAGDNRADRRLIDGLRAALRA
jgi:predicted N-formylglutamate amidohydrolase